MTEQVAIGAECEIIWNDDPTNEAHPRYISLGKELSDDNGDVISDEFGVTDAEIFYYAEGVAELEHLSKKHDNEDFRIKSYELIYAHLSQFGVGRA